MTMQGFQQPITIISALRAIGDRSYLLPAIQRRFVWSNEKIEALFDSLMRGYPINSFMFWSITDSKVKQEVRFYDFISSYRQHFNEQNAEVPTLAHKDFFAVIDGQQRLTALYLGLFGTYADKLPRLWLKDTEEAIPTRQLYLNLVERRSGDDELGMDYDFRFLTNRDVVAKGEASSWFKVGDIVRFGDVEMLDEYIDEHWPKNEEARETLRCLRRVVHHVPAINYFVESDQDINRVLDIFIRTNSGGVPLSYSDWLMAYTTSQWRNRDARAEFDKLVDQVFNIGGSGFLITKDFILKTCLVLFSGDVRFKLANLNSSTIDELEKNWDRVAKAILATFEFLAARGFNEKNLRAKVPVTPIVQYVYLRGAEGDWSKPQTYDADKKAVQTWLRMSLLKGVFRSQTDHMLNSLRKIVEVGACAHPPNFPLEKIRREYGGHEVRDLTFDDEFVKQMLSTQIGDTRAFALLTLLYSHIDYSLQKIDLDHLHPRAEIDRIRDLPEAERPTDWEFVIDPANWDSIANLQPLNESLNRSKQDQPLADWVSERNVERTAYLLPADVELDIGSFRAFIEARRVLLAERLREVVKGTMS